MTVLYSESQRKFYDSDSGRELTPVQAERQKLAESTGPIESALIGAGRTFSNIGQSLGIGGGDRQPGDEAGYEALRQANPISTGVGEALPMAAPIPGGLAAQVIGGATLGGMGADPGSSLEGATLGGVGGGIGHATGRILSRVFGADPQNLMYAKGPARDVMETGGLVRTGEATGSDAIKSLERAIEVTPAGKALYSGTRGKRVENVNRLAREALGLPKGKGFGDDAIEAAYDSVGAKFDAVRDSIPDLTVPADLADDLRTYLGQSSRLKATLTKKGAQGFDGDGPMEVSGDAIMDMRSRLLKRNKTPSQDSPIYEDIIESIDELVEASSPVSTQWADARSDYRLLKMLEKSTTNNNVSPAKLANRMRDWRITEGAKGDLRKNIMGLTSRDFTNTFGNSGTPDALLGAVSLPLSPLIAGGGGILNSVLDMGNAATILGGATGRAGLLSQQE